MSYLRTYSRKRKSVLVYSSAVLTVLSSTCSAFVPYFTSSASFHHPTARAHRKLYSTATNAAETIDVLHYKLNGDSVMSRGVLCSSFSDGVAPSEFVGRFLRESIQKCMINYRLKQLEGQVAESAVVSSCCGPMNIDDLSLIEDVEATMMMMNNNVHFNNNNNNNSSCSEQNGLLLNEAMQKLSIDDKTVRLVYINTAMLALNVDSTNTPGKQRQRSRADAKKRRELVEGYLSTIMGENFILQSVTLDLDDDSIKQPSGDFKAPKSGKDALENWKPHVIYVEGGNTFWLHHCIEKGRYSEIIKKSCSNNKVVYIGKSAGAIAAGKRVETACWKQMDDPRVVEDKSSYSDWVGVEALNISGGISIFPHMAQKWEDLIQSETKGLLDDYVVTLTDEDCVCIDATMSDVGVVKVSQSVLNGES